MSPSTSTSWVPAKSTPTIWRPHAGQQVRFMASPAWEALFGGAAGPGKTDCLVMEALRQVDNPRYNAILLRRVFPSLEAADGMIARSLRWYPSLGGDYNFAKHFWTFPSGARIYFGQIQHESSKFLYQGTQFSFIGFDELTEFTETQYTYMFTRLRAPIGSGLREYIRACTNPGNIGHQWVKDRFITKGIVNNIRWFTNDPVKGDYEVPYGSPRSKSRAFYPAKLEDNPSLGDAYLTTLQMDSDAVQRSRLIDGNWDAEYTQGLVYSNWSVQDNITVNAEYNPNRAVIWGFDDGFVYGAGPGTLNFHPRVVLLCQVNELGGINVVDEYAETGIADYKTTVDDMFARGYAKPDVVYMDSSAAMAKGALWNMGLDIVPASMDVLEGIRNLRQMICNADGMRLIKVHPRCSNLIYEMSRYRNNDTAQGRGGEPIPFKQDDHSCDALRYVSWYQRFGG